MEKSEVAQVLEEIGTLLELKGENPFKSRAYHNAARIIDGLDQDLASLVCEKKLSSIKGIGEGLSEKITTLVTTGRLPYLNELHKSLPAGLLDLIRIQGLGPKRAKILYDELNIKDTAGLEKACREGKIARLDGFGEKSQENILKGLEFLNKHAEQHRYDEALSASQEAMAELKKIPQIQRLSVCGSLRRHREIIRDIDILASYKTAKAGPAPIMESFVNLHMVERILGQGETKSSILTRDGFQVDLRVVSDAQFPYALHYFTGSKEHNIAVRHLANQKGYKLSEYGLFQNETRVVSCKDEADLFKKLGMAFIPPEMREDRGEIEAALANKVPRLLEPSDIRGAFHVHSTWSDGRAPLEAMVAAAQDLGWDYVGISDHSKSAAYAHGLDTERVRQQGKEIEALRKKFKIHIFWGTECDILKDGSLDYPESVLAAYDFVIASVHSNFTLSEPDMTRRIVKALRNPHTTFLGHLTGRLLLEREAYAVDQAEVLSVAGAEGVAVELNANPHRFDIDWRMLPLAREKKVTISINPDAHSVEGLQDVPFGVGIARKGWLTQEGVLNAWPLQEVCAWLSKRR